MHEDFPLGYIFPRLILCTFFSFLLIYGGLGVKVLGLGSWIGFSGLGFQLIGFGACSVRPSCFFRVRALCIDIEE